MMTRRCGRRRRRRRRRHRVWDERLARSSDVGDERHGDGGEDETHRLYVIISPMPRRWDCRRHNLI